MFKFFTRLIHLGIRRESKNRWECRTPLTPKNVRELLLNTDAKVTIQPCKKRVFSDKEYEEAGALLSESLNDCDFILGVKEIPRHDLKANKSYLFFSHTFKGQKHNMPMLADIIDKKITLMDYELITDSDGKRLVAFGSFAGSSGMINCLHGCGDRLLTMGYRTPLLVITDLL